MYVLDLDPISLSYLNLFSLCKGIEQHQLHALVDCCRFHLMGRNHPKLSQNSQLNCMIGTINQSQASKL